MKFPLKNKSIYLSVIFLMISCGGSAPNDGLTGDETLAQVSNFKGIESLTKQDDNSWLLKWTPLDTDGVVYGVFKAASNTPFEYEEPFTNIRQNIYRYVPENIFTEDITCFSVRVTNISGDENTEQLCTDDTPLTFSGLNNMERQGGGEYLLGWEAIPVDGVIYSIFESKNGANYTFEQPSIDALKDNFYKTPVIQRGEKYCYIVRYYQKDLDLDENLIEMCTEEEDPISFAGITSIAQQSSNSAKLTWSKAASEEVTSYNIYNGSDFKELISNVDGNSVEVTLDGLVTGTQYDFGIRAVDSFGREDTNVKILPIIMK